MPTFCTNRGKGRLILVKMQVALHWLYVLSVLTYTVITGRKRMKDFEGILATAFTVGLGYCGIIQTELWIHRDEVMFFIRNVIDFERKYLPGNFFFPT